MKSHLLIWKLLIAPVLIAFLFFILVDSESFENFRRAGMFAEELKDVRFEKNESGVLLIGNSLLQHALPREDTISQRFNSEVLKQTGEQFRIRAYKIAVPGLPAVELRNNQKKIVSLHPKLIILQSELFFPNLPEESPKTVAALYDTKKRQIQRWSRLFKVSLVPFIQEIEASPEASRPPASMNPDAMNAPDVRKAPEIDVTAQRLEWLWGKRKIDRNAEQYLACKKLIDAAHASGIRIAVIDMPMSVRASMIVPPNYLEERYSAIHEILGPSDFYLRYTEPLPDYFFWDYSHLKVRGRSAFFQWIIQKFAQHWPS